MRYPWTEAAQIDFDGKLNRARGKKNYRGDCGSQFDDIRTRNLAKIPSLSSSYWSNADQCKVTLKIAPTIHPRGCGDSSESQQRFPASLAWRRNGIVVLTSRPAGQGRRVFLLLLGGLSVDGLQGFRTSLASGWSCVVGCSHSPRSMRRHTFPPCKPTFFTVCVLRSNFIPTRVAAIICLLRSRKKERKTLVDFRAILMKKTTMWFKFKRAYRLISPILARLHKLNNLGGPNNGINANEHVLQIFPTSSHNDLCHLVDKTTEEAIATSDHRMIRKKNKWKDNVVSMAGKATVVWRMSHR